MSRAVVVLGDLMTDVLTRVAGEVATGSDAAARIRLLGGGSGANVAAWLGALGHPVTYVGRVGDDALGRAAVAALQGLGVRTEIGVEPGLPTGTCVVLVAPDGERSMLPDPGANSSLRPDHLPAHLFAPGAHLHLSGYTLLNPGSRAAGLVALERARAVGMTISVDPSSSAPLQAVGVALARSWLRGADRPVDVVMPNDDELRVLTGLAGASGAQALAATLGALVVATRGAAGALAVTPVGAVAEVDAAPVEVVDTTGCGDAFAAGFLQAWLDRPADHGAALRAGASVAAECAVLVGGRPRGQVAAVPPYVPELVAG